MIKLELRRGLARISLRAENEEDDRDRENHHASHVCGDVVVAIERLIACAQNSSSYIVDITTDTKKS
jgi:hypothetical protein